MRAVAVAALAVPATAGALVASPVTGLRVAPNPFYSDEPRMRVTFTTAAPAPAGKRYFVYWNTEAPRSTLPDNCSPASDLPDQIGAKGGTRATVRMTVKPEPLFGDAFCPGPSTVRVLLKTASPSGRTLPSGGFKVVAALHFRVQQP